VAAIYFVFDEEPELEGDDDVVVSLEVLGVLGVAVGGGGVVAGEADGVRSPGRSLTRPVPDWLHADASVATSASAAKLNSALFMRTSLVFDQWRKIATAVPVKCR
jgi:hypothetical protein